jgi:hypothetical protein
MSEVNQRTFLVYCGAGHARVLEGVGQFKGNGANHPLFRKFNVSRKSICVHVDAGKSSRPLKNSGVGTKPS